MDDGVGKVFEIGHGSGLSLFWDEVIVARDRAGCKDEGLEGLVGNEMWRGNSNRLGVGNGGNRDDDAGRSGPAHVLNRFAHFLLPAIPACPAFPSMSRNVPQCPSK